MRVRWAILGRVLLYDFWRSSSAWRVRTGLHHKGLEFDQVPVDLYADENDEAGFAAINPLTQVPILEIEHQGAVVRLSQSLAILQLLEQLYPFKRLFPSDPVARAQCLQLAEIINAGIQPLQNRSVLKYVTSIGGDGHGFAKHFIARGLDAFERTAQASAGEFCVGDEVTIADLYLVPELDVARRLDVPLSRYETLLRIERTCVQLDAFAAAHPNVQPDAPQRLSRPSAETA